MKKWVLTIVLGIVFLFGNVKDVFATRTTEMYGPPGTCSYKYDYSKSTCVVYENFCNRKTGWEPNTISYEKSNEAFTNYFETHKNEDRETIAMNACKDLCECVGIEDIVSFDQGYGFRNLYFQKNICYSHSVGVFNLKHYVMENWNFCDTDYYPQLFWNQKDVHTYANCKCILLTEKDDLDPREIVPEDKITKISTTGGGFVDKTTIASLGVDMFCTENGIINEKDPRVKTAIGCLPVTINGFIGWIVPSLFGIIGGIAFLIMIYGFIMMSASDGDPKKAQAAKETITAAITGLLLSIFAIFLVRLIMLYILKLPGVK